MPTFIRVSTLLAVLLFFHHSSFACGRLIGYSTQYVYTDTKLDMSYDIVFEDEAIPCIEDLCELRFLVTSSIGSFSSPGLVLRSKNSCFSDFEITPLSIAGQEGTVEIRMSSDSGGVGCGGETMTLGCIMTIDDLFGALLLEPDECYEYDIKLSGVVASYCDGNEISISQEFEGSTAYSQFCPKCDAKNLSVSYSCEGEQYYVDFSFEGNGSANYYLSLESGGATIDAGTGGAYNIGPLSSDFHDTLVLEDAEGDLCKVPIHYDCSFSASGPSCADGILNQDETEVDCGGSCPDCLSCDLVIEIANSCDSSESFSLAVVVEGSGSYTITDGLGDLIGPVAEGTYSFGPYTADQEPEITVVDEGDTACTLSKVSKFHACDCSVNNIKAVNDFCSDAIMLNVGSNGPFNNFCATHVAGETEGNPSCFTDQVTNSVWFSYAGNGEQVVISAGDCDGSLSYSDVQIAVYASCAGAEVACSDDENLLVPQVSFFAEEGTMYYIMVDGYGGLDPRSSFCISTCEGTIVSAETNHDSCDQSEGSIILDVVGSGPFSFSWSDGDTSEDRYDLSSGVYSVEITNAQGCQVNRIFVVRGAAAPLTYTMQSNNQGALTTTVFHYNSALIEVAGGTPPYDFSHERVGYMRMDEAETTANVLYRDDSQWWITVTDSEGCELVLANDSGVQDSTVDISDFTLAPPNTCDDTNGAIMIQVTGGLPPYFYSWSNGSVYQNLTGLSKGFYHVTVTDSSNPYQETTGSYWLNCGREGRLKSFPNPAAGNSVSIEWQCEKPGSYELELIDLQGRTLKNLKYSFDEAGLLSIDLDVSDLRAGVYLANIIGIKGLEASAKLFVQ